MILQYESIGDYPKRTIRSSRKTMAIVINKEAEVIVRAPYAISSATIDNFINSKLDWIASAQKRVQAEKARRLAYMDNDTLFYLGKSYTIKYIDNGHINIDCNNATICIPNSQKAQKNDYIKKWYKSVARVLLKSRLDDISQNTGIEYGRFSLSSAKTRWGSCGAKGNINLSWRLIQFPQYVIDYVIIHELCHIEHKNHKKIYWQKVASLCPQYKSAEKWLKEYRHLAYVYE